MKRRLAIPALVGVVTFFVVSIGFNIAHSAVVWYRNTSSAAGIAGPLYGALFGLIDAGVAFGVGAILKMPASK